MAQRTTTRSDSSTVVDYRYDHDKAGRLTGESNHGQTANYTYDRAGQIVAAVRTGQPNEAYSYDAAGNPTESGRVVGVANRLQSDNTFDYQYDDEGNQTRKVERASGEVTNFAYDYRNRLTGVERRSSGGVLLSKSRFTYDVYDRLIVRSVNGVVSSTVYDGEHAWADYAANGAVSARYLFGDRTDELLARWRSANGLAWPLADKQGSIPEWIDGSVASAQPLNGRRIGFLSETWPGGNVSGGSVYPSPEPFHLTRRIYVGMTSLVEVPRTVSFRSVPEVICAFERSSCVVSGA